MIQRTRGVLIMIRQTNERSTRRRAAAAVDNDDVGARGFELTTADEAGAKGPTRPGTRAAAGGECGAGVGLG